LATWHPVPATVQLEEQVSAWRGNPDAQATILLAARLATSGDEQLVREVGASAQTWHVSDCSVMLAIGQMYLRRGLLGEAQGAFVLAGKADPRHHQPFYWLAMLLLRRGDRARSQKLLARALELGADYDAVRPWLHRVVESSPPPQKSRVQPTSAPSDAGPAFESSDSEADRIAGPDHGSDAGAEMQAGAAAESTRLLQQLSIAGIYEPMAAPAAWEQAGRRRRSRIFGLVFAMISVLVVGGATLAYAGFVKAHRATAARERCERASAALKSGMPSVLIGSSSEFSEIFELDSTSQRAALLWLQQRVLASLWLGQPASISEALERARRVGLSEHQLAFGNAAALAAEGDVAGSASVLSRWDARTEGNAFYQLVSGIVLERLGHPIALERYANATRLDPELLVAKLLLARLTLLELGTEAGRPLVGELAASHGERLEVRLLVAMLWSLADRSAEPPPELELDSKQVESLSVQFRAAAAIFEAARDLEAGDRQHALRRVKAGLEVADAPAALVQLGNLAIRGGDPLLAQKAVNRLQPFHATYRRAQGLPVRVALLAGDLERAQQAADALRPEVLEAHLVGAVVAYEQLNAATFQTALSLLRRANTEDHQALESVARTLTGKGYPDTKTLTQLARPEVPWGELIAVDLALDLGNLELAERWVERWPVKTLKPAHQLRIARLARYRKQARQALLATEAALAQAPPTAPALLERAYALLLARQADAVLKLLEQHAERLGPMLPWLEALAGASLGNARQLRFRLVKTPAPNAAAPMMVRIVAARAMAAVGDARGKSFMQMLARQVPTHPDLVAAGKSP
jgi:tetratricopeptide (TPR) repeat protein